MRITKFLIALSKFVPKLKFKDAQLINDRNTLNCAQWGHSLALTRVVVSSCAEKSCRSTLTMSVNSWPCLVPLHIAGVWHWYGPQMLCIISDYEIRSIARTLANISETTLSCTCQCWLNESRQVNSISIITNGALIYSAGATRWYFWLDTCSLRSASWTSDCKCSNIEFIIPRWLITSCRRLHPANSRLKVKKSFAP